MYKSVNIVLSFTLSLFLMSVESLTQHSYAMDKNGKYFLVESVAVPKLGIFKLTLGHSFFGDRWQPMAIRQIHLRSLF